MIIYLLYLINLGFFFIGYIIGRDSKPEEDVKRAGTLTLEKMGKLYKQATTQSIPTGQIRKLTPEEIKKRNMTPQQREGLDAMRETLDATPELKVHRELVEKLKKEGQL